MRGHSATEGKIVPMELLRHFAPHWRWAVVTFVTVAFAIIVPLSQVKPRWEAQVTVRIGQVYDALTDTSRPIQVLDDILERMHVKSFLEIAVKGGGAPSDALDQGLLESTKIQPIPSTSLIRITARGSSAEQTTHYVRSLSDYLRSTHEQIARSVQSEAELLAKEYTKELASLREVQSNLEKAFASAIGSDMNDRQSALVKIASVIERNSRETRDVERQKFLLGRRGEFYSRPTEVIGTVSLMKIASTSRGLVVFFGIVMGLAAGLAVAILRDYFFRMRSQRSSG